MGQLGKSIPYSKESNDFRFHVRLFLPDNPTTWSSTLSLPIMLLRKKRAVI